MRKFIKKVTLTGADDSVNPRDLLLLSKKYPFVEWGILLSARSEGLNRFPSYDWQKQLSILSKNATHNFNLSGHVCGKWVRSICAGNWADIMHSRALMYQMFGRYQLNFHNLLHRMDKEA